MKNRTAIKLVILSMLAFAGMLETANAVGVSETDLKIMEKKVEEKSMEHKKLQAQANQINMELAKISQEMISAAKQIQNNEDKISATEKKLELLKKDLKEKEDRFLAEDENLIKTISALQNLALKPTEALFVQPLSPVDIIRSAILLREAVPYLEGNAERIRKELEEIDRQKNNIEKQYEKMSKQKKSLEAEHTRMKLLVQRKSKIKNAVEIKSVQTKRNADKLANQAQDLRDLLTKLEKQRLDKKRKQEEEKRKLAELRRKEQEKTLAQEAKKEQDLHKYQTDSISEIGKDFVKAKGKLSKPARGPIITAFGEEKVKGVSSKGIIIKTRNQAQVISPFDGSVIFAGPFRGYGNLIIIEHGQGYLSLLAGLETMDVELGQMLLAGEPVGQMPNSTDAKLYVELRRDNHPINPEAWIEK